MDSSGKNKHSETFEPAPTFWQADCQFSRNNCATLNGVADYYIAAFRKSGSTYLYINGCLIGISNGLDGTNQDTGSTAPIIIGALVMTTSSTYYHIDGKIWDVKITKGELSPSDETAIQNGDIPSSSNLSLHLPLSEGAGSTAYDISGSGNHGTINANLSTFWGARQDKFHYNLLKGHSKGTYFDGSTYSETLSYGFDWTADWEVTVDAIIPPGVTQSLIGFFTNRTIGNNQWVTFGARNFGSGLVPNIEIGNAGTNFNLSGTTLVADGKKRSYRYIYTVSTLTIELFVDGVSAGTQVLNSNQIGDTTSPFKLGMWLHPGQNMIGQLSNLTIDNYATYALDEPVANAGTIIDSSGNGNDLTLGTGSLPAIRVPALADASADAAGGTLLNPSWNGVGNNDSETSIDKNIELEAGNVLSSVEWDKQDMLHYNLFHGFTQEGDCSIPAIPGKFTDYYGNDLTNLPWDGINSNGSESYWKNL